VILLRKAGRRGLTSLKKSKEGGGGDGEPLSESVLGGGGGVNLERRRSSRIATYGISRGPLLARGGREEEDIILAALNLPSSVPARRRRITLVRTPTRPRSLESKLGPMAEQRTALRIVFLKAVFLSKALEKRRLEAFFQNLMKLVRKRGSLAI
jgi:hypothetical protein